MTGPVLITGATSGLGLETARILAARGHSLILGHRDLSRAEIARRAVTDGAPDAEVELIPLDLADLSSVERAVADLRDGERPLAAVICNAGLQIVDGVQRSADGHELTFAINHLGHFHLVTSLGPAIAPGGRVVVVSSDVHQGPRKSLGFPAPQWRSPRELADPAAQDTSAKAGRVRYATSKLANVYFAYELARRLSDREITANAFDPGLMPETGLTRDYPAPMRIGYRLMTPLTLRVMPIARTVRGSAGDLARLATAPELAGVTGKYFTGADEVTSAPESYDLDRARELWEVSAQLVAAGARLPE